MPKKHLTEKISLLTNKLNIELRKNLDLLRSGLLNNNNKKKKKRKIPLLARKENIELRKKLVRCYVWNIALYGSET